MVLAGRWEGKERQWRTKKNAAAFQTSNAGQEPPHVARVVPASSAPDRVRP